MKHTLPVLFLAAFSFCCQAQEIKWPVRETFRRHYNAPVPGYAVTKNGDTARGFIRLQVLGEYYDVWDTATNTIRNLYYQIVAFMRIYKTGPDGLFTDYFNLSYKRRIWRLLAKKNDVCLYDDILRGGPPHIILVTPSARIKLYTGMRWFLHNGTMSNPGLLIHFINKRYKTSLAKDHFTSMEAIYDYILTKENERMVSTDRL